MMATSSPSWISRSSSRSTLTAEPPEPKDFEIARASRPDKAHLLAGPQARDHLGYVVVPAAHADLSLDQAAAVQNERVVQPALGKEGRDRNDRDVLGVV